MKSINRRNFLRTTATGVAGITALTNLKASGSESFSDENDTSGIIKRKLGNTDLEIPIVSIGCSHIDSEAVIKAALRLGINHFDTAHRYQKGNNEVFLGKALANYPRESFSIATKILEQPTKEKFLEMLEESLSRLKMKYVDILYLHAVSERDVALNPEMLSALETARKLGKAKYLGISTHKNEVDIIQAAIESKVYNVVLTAINFKQEHYPQLKNKIAEAAQNGIGIIGMKVMAGGFLDKEKTKAVNYKAALKWVVRDPNICTTIPAMVNFDQLQDNAAVLKDIELSDDEMSSLKLASAETGLYCNACEVCVKTCPKKLPIAELMRAYMYAFGYGNTAQAKGLLTDSGSGENPCSGCNACVVKCPQGFRVADRIKDISRLSGIPNEFLA